MKTLKILTLILAASSLILSCGNNAKTIKKGSLTDIDGNSYSTVTLGAQTWTVENLKTTKYNDGTPIANVTDDQAWKELKTGAYSWYKNDSSAYKAKLGAFYNWYAVNTGKLCPTGWRVASDKEWRVMTNLLGGEMVAGMAMKTASGWSNNGNGNNSSAFTAIPAGYRSAKGPFSSQGVSGYWWSSSSTELNAWYCVLFSKDATAYKYYGTKESGFSVRCLKN